MPLKNVWEEILWLFLNNKIKGDFITFLHFPNYFVVCICKFMQMWVCRTPICACVGMDMCPYMCIRRPDIDIKCLPLSLSTLVCLLFARVSH